MREVNLATLADCSEQEVFDWVASRLHAQKFKPSFDSVNEMCAYRGSNGKRCAAGWCMTDAEYAQLSRFARNGSIEGYKWADLVDAGLVPEEHQHLIVALQNAHDAHPDPAQMAAALREVAVDHRLDLGAVDA